MINRIHCELSTNRILCILHTCGYIHIHTIERCANNPGLKFSMDKSLSKVIILVFVQFSNDFPHLWRAFSACPATYSPFSQYFRHFHRHFPFIFNKSVNGHVWGKLFSAHLLVPFPFLLISIKRNLFNIPCNFIWCYLFICIIIRIILYNLCFITNFL